MIAPGQYWYNRDIFKQAFALLLTEASSQNDFLKKESRTGQGKQEFAPERLSNGTVAALQRKMKPTKMRDDSSDVIGEAFLLELKVNLWLHWMGWAIHKSRTSCWSIIIVIGQDFCMNMANASHMDDVWERVIRTVQSVLNVIYTARWWITHRLMLEVELIVSSRPLTLITWHDFKGPTWASYPNPAVNAPDQFGLASPMKTCETRPVL